MLPPFKYCPICGSPEFLRESDALIVCRTCQFHYHVNPIVAVAGFLADEKGQLLLIRRAKEPAKGKLAVPGGFVDLGETAEQALHREVKEEVNLELESVTYLSSHPNKYLYRGITYPVVDIFFVGKVRSWAGANAALGEVESLSWRHPRDLDGDELAFESMKAAFECYKSLR